jgi:hypothetical protein
MEPTRSSWRCCLLTRVSHRSYHRSRDDMDLGGGSVTSVTGFIQLGTTPRITDLASERLLVCRHSLFEEEGPEAEGFVAVAVSCVEAHLLCIDRSRLWFPFWTRRELALSLPMSSLPHWLCSKRRLLVTLAPQRILSTPWHSFANPRALRARPGMHCMHWPRSTPALSQAFAHPARRSLVVASRPSCALRPH